MIKRNRRIERKAWVAGGPGVALGYLVAWLLSSLFGPLPPLVELAVIGLVSFGAGYGWPSPTSQVSTGWAGPPSEEDMQ